MKNNSIWDLNLSFACLFLKASISAWLKICAFNRVVFQHSNVCRKVCAKILVFSFIYIRVGINSATEWYSVSGWQRCRSRCVIRKFIKKNWVFIVKKLCYSIKSKNGQPKAENGRVWRTFLGTATSTNGNLMKLSGADITLS